MMSVRFAILPLLLCVLFMPTAAHAQLKQPSPLSGEIAPSNQSRLAQRRSALLDELDAVQHHIDTHNQQCSSVPDSNTALVASCEQSRSAVGQEIARYKNDLASYEQSLAFAVRASPSLIPVEPPVVDARNVPSGLPKSIEAEIPNTPAGNRVRKGFEAIVDHDWNVAHAWFQDALNHDPGNAGIQRLIELAEYTMKRAKDPHPKAPPGKPAADTSAQDKAARATLDQQLDDQMNADEAQAFYDFNRNYLSKHPDSAEKTNPADKANVSSPPEPPPAEMKANWKAFFDALFVPPPRVYEVGAVRD